jgi:hypothetical protein
LIPALVVTACGSTTGSTTRSTTGSTNASTSGSKTGSNGPGHAGTSSVGLRVDQRPVPIGVGPAYRIAPISPAVAHRWPVAGWRCVPASALARPYGAHLELFARRRVVPVPAGIGVAPPQRRRGAYVLGGACEYPLRTLEPTGVIRVSVQNATLGNLFAVWGQPLSARRMATFGGHVAAFVDGRPWRGSPRAIPLRRHAEIVLEVGRLIPPHPSYTFPDGL